MTIVSLFCVMRFTGPSNVQSKMMLVVWQLKRGLSSRLNSAAAFSPSGGQLGAAVEPRPGGRPAAAARRRRRPRSPGLAVGDAC